jgi:putative tryptophan/tyrosine transport system substrate-binding protein
MSAQMRRRELITLLGGAAAWPVAARAQPPALPVVGSLQGTAQGAEAMAGFHRGLSEMGYVEGRNLAIEYRWAEGQFDRLPAMATDLVSRRVAAIFAGPDVGIQAAMAATKTIPIVFATASDPVAAGFVASLARPDGNATGIAMMGVELVAKRLDLLRTLLPGATRIALLVNPNNPGIMQNVIQSSQTAARRLGLEIVVVRAGSESEIEGAIAAAVQQHAAALSMGSDSYFVSRSRLIAFLSLRHALPAIATTREYATAGLLMSYGTSLTESYREAGVYIGRILKGEKPADLPVAQPTKLNLVINLTTAKALGLDLPPTLLALADEVIE